MVNVAPSFLTLPPREEKPRDRGITHVLDKGIPVAGAEGLLETAAPHLDIWKFGWGTAYLDPGVRAKVAMLAQAHVLACTGGTLLEVAWQQGVVDEYFDWAGDIGFPCVEVSCGVATMSAAERTDLIAQAADRFIVVAEVGTKDEQAPVLADEWAHAAREDRAAGARWIITEGRESGTVGLFEPDGSVRPGVVAAVVDAVGLDATIFEAPQKSQQAWLINRYGPNVNLANIPLADALGLEALRRGLRADTFALSAALRGRAVATTPKS
jgi:phosphosulfolactate synthase